MKLKTLQDLYIEELRDLYDAENQLLKAIPRMVEAATSGELRSAFEEHLEQTKEHVARLERVFENFGANPKGKKCNGMAGLIKEAKELIEEDIEPEVLDAGLISAAQRVEHYEMAGYGCVATYAKLLGNEEEAELLHQTLEEERETDETLTDIAESSINLEAMGGDEEEEPAEGSKKGKRSK